MDGVNIYEARPFIPTHASTPSQDGGWQPSPSSASFAQPMTTKAALAGFHDRHGSENFLSVTQPPTTTGPPSAGSPVRSEGPPASPPASSAGAGLSNDQNQQSSTDRSRERAREDLTAEELVDLLNSRLRNGNISIAQLHDDTPPPVYGPGPVADPSQ